LIEEQPSAEEKIIRATIECIEKHGVQGATIRRIAEMAGVNSAAISYYFRSKDRLMALAMERALENAFDWQDFSSSEDLPPKERLVAILEDLMQGALRYPGTARALFYASLMEGDYDIPAVKRLNRFLEDLLEDLRFRGLSADPARLRTAIAQITAASFMLAALLPRVFDDFVGGSFADSEFRSRYLRELVEALLAH
jgi:AcrR family transcriptional regulator